MSKSFTYEPPIRTGTAKEFEHVRAALKNAHFDEETICRTLKIETMSDVGSVKSDMLDSMDISDALRILIRLFLFQRLVPRSEAERVLNTVTCDAFLSLGILGVGEFGDDQFYATVLLYPVGGFWIASDRHSNPDGSEFTAPPDIVFPAIYGGTLRFLQLLPQSVAEDALDLCAGSGIGAFVLSRHSKRVVSSDLTERATKFVAFNSALNNRDNVEAVCSDLYDALEGRTFDLIVAHPPYVPSLKIGTIWRDGGMTGELVVKRIIEGLPHHLREGGRFFVLSIGLDTSEGPFEERARKWLGETGDVFDIIFAYFEESTPVEMLKRLAAREHNLGIEELHELGEAFRAEGTIKMPYGALLMRRHAKNEHSKRWTARMKLNEETDGRDWEGAFALHRWLSQPGFFEELQQARPALAPGLLVRVTHVVHEGSLVPAEFLFETDKPFTAVGRLDPWMVPLIARFDGTKTPGQIYNDAKPGSELPEDFGLRDFTELVARLIERGYLILQDS
jgi:SAM-dependent methyltransferase